MDIRSDFPILQRKISGKPLVYLDNAATTQKPIQVIDAIADFYKNHCGNAGRGAHTLAREASDIIESARKNIAKFIGAKADEIIFTNNATQGLNMVAGSYTPNLSRYDKIVTTVLEHHSNYLPWKIASEKTKAILDIVDIKKNGELNQKDYLKKVSSKTAIVAAAHVSNVLGTINPVEKMAKIAHENEAVFVLDGAQSVPHMKINVKKLDCDFMAFSGHKMLGPTGIGILYGRSDLLEDMKPSLYGGGMISSVSRTIELLKAPRRFEAGTQNLGGIVGLSTAIDYLRGLGMDNVEKHETKLADYVLENMDGVNIYGPKKRAGLISFNISGMESDEVALVLDEQAIAIRSGQHCAEPLIKRLKVKGTARMSFYIYNTLDEARRTVEVIEKIKELA